MDDIYEITIKTPDGTSYAKADNGDVFVKAATSMIEKVGVADTRPKSIDEEARDALEKYNAKYAHGNLCRSRITKAGLMSDAAKCYLKGMTAKETVQWLKQNRSFTASVTAVGRLWTRLYRAGIVPPCRRLQYQLN